MNKQAKPKGGLAAALEEIRADVPTTDDKTPTPSADKIRAEFKVRGINAWESYKCCVKGRNDATRVISEVADVVEGIATQVYDHIFTPGFVAPPQPSTVFPGVRYVHRPVTTPKSPGPAIWVIGLIAMQELLSDGWHDVDPDPWEIPRDEPQMQVAIRALRATATKIRVKSDEICYRCTKRRLWGQKKKRQWVTPRPLRKGPRTRDSLLLRVPHQ